MTTQPSMQHAMVRHRRHVEKAMNTRSYGHPWMTARMPRVFWRPSASAATTRRLPGRSPAHGPLSRRFSRLKRICGVLGRKVELATRDAAQSLADVKTPPAVESIESAIHVVRDQRVMLDAYLARLYGVQAGAGGMEGYVPAFCR